MNAWLLIAHRCELATPGDYVCLPDGTTAYNAGGDIVVWSGQCPHRGTRIFDAGVGNRPLVCPYHGWRDSFITDKVSRYLTAFIGDFLFFANGPTDLLERQLGDTRDALIYLSQRMKARHSLYRLPMACRPEVAIENALEDIHVPQIHPETIGRLGLECEEMDDFAPNSIAYYRMTDERTVGGLTKLQEQFEHVTPDRYFHAFIWPYVCLSSAGGFTYSLQHYFPSDTGSTVLWSRLFSPSLKAPMNAGVALFFNEAARFNCMVFEEDAKICARVVGRGKHLTNAERRIAWFRREIDRRS